jgi:hypothetical protein
LRPRAVESNFFQRFAGQEPGSPDAALPGRGVLQLWDIHGEIHPVDALDLENSRALKEIGCGAR